MKKRIANMWVRALRSGKYKQGMHYLKQKGMAGLVTQHCCLGVLCELYNKSMKRSGKKGISEKSRSSITHFGGIDTVLPSKVMNWAGIKENHGGFDGGCLASMNDDGVSFKKIAQVIERNVESL